MNKRIRIIILIAIILVIIGMIANYAYKKYQIYLNEYEGTEFTKGTDVEVIIPEGSSVKAIATILKEKGLIQFEIAFVNRVKDSEYRGKLKYGTYTLNTGMNTGQMIEVIAGGAKPWKTITIPEGYSVEMIGAKLEEEGICTREEFLNALNISDYDYDFLDTVPNNSELKYKLQGFLFPATYGIMEDDTPEDIVNEMLQKFDSEYTEEDQARADELGFSTFEVVTQGAIVEREAKIEEERPTIAGVINNRLDSGMKLEMCPTVLYVVTNGMYDLGLVSAEDTKVDSPYNTYMYEGLPVGPICNPGKASIEAILYPDTHNYFFYHVYDETIGNHIFTETYEEHSETQ
mgnify:CR=1 FL=1